MSHFTVLVIGNDPESLLAPYHEFECTGENDQYVQDIDQTEEVQEQINKSNLHEGLEWFGLENKVVSDESDIDKDGAHQYGYAIVVDGKLIKAVKRTNPNAKWDWYQLGGRWSGFFKVKPNSTGTQGERSLLSIMSGQPAPDAGTADQALKGSIDFEGMRNDAANCAQKRYEDIQLAFDGEIPQVEIPWKTIVDGEGQFKDMSMDERRNFYHNQPSILKVNEARSKNSDVFGFFIDLEKFQISKEEYVQKAREDAISTFAVIKDGKWYEKGVMGWWACVSNEKEQPDWNKEFNSLIDNLPDDTLLSIYDCHI